MSSKQRITKEEKKAIKALRKFQKGNYGQDDGTVRPVKSLSWLRKAAIKSALTESYIKDKNTL